MASKHRRARRAGPLVVVWGEGEAEPWPALTGPPPTRVGVARYGLRIRVALGFRALKSVGWRWQRTRRADPARIARHWLVLAVATLGTLAYGTRVEDAAACGVPPARRRTPPAGAPAPPARPVSVFQQGLSWLRWLRPQGRWWRRLRPRPEPWPRPAPGLALVYHDPP